MQIVIDISEEVKNRLCFGITYQKDIQTICEAMNNGTPLDKIRAEMEQIAKGEPKYVNGVMNCLEIIDKYKAESEDKG